MTTAAVRSTEPGYDDTVDLLAIRRLAYSIARDLTDRIEPDELAQEAITRYWTEFGTKGRPANLYGWLRTIIRRLAIDQDRRIRGRDGERPGAA